MHERLQDLKDAFLGEPGSAAARDAFRAACVEDGAWLELYQTCAELAESVADAPAGREVWKLLLQAIMAHIGAAHIGTTDDPILRSELHSRAGDVLCAHLDDSAGGGENYRLAFEAFPDTQSLERASVLFQAPSERPFVLRLLEEKERLLDDPAEREALGERIAGL